MEPLNKALETLKDLPRFVQGLLILAVLVGFLAFTYLSKEGDVAPTKQVGNINQGGSQTTSGGDNQSNNAISF